MMDSEGHVRRKAAHVVTAKRIAKDLGLSQAAVSLALNQRPGVSDATRKRVARTGDNAGTLSLRMFRLDFTADDAARTITLTALRSGYTSDELALPEDPYSDKALHRAFTAT